MKERLNKRKELVGLEIQKGSPYGDGWRGARHALRTDTMVVCGKVGL